MAESITIIGSSKSEIYRELLPQIEAVISSESNITANLANVSAILKEAFGWFWVGFYMCEDDSQLVLAPFQGPLACTRIFRGRGVCGTAWQRGETILVDDVEQFAGHIACSSLSRSEIVVPIWVSNEVVGVLDVDSLELSAFDSLDRQGLEDICGLISKMILRCNV